MILLLAGLLISNSLNAAELRVGAAAVAINPPTGIPLAGYYFERGSDGVLDDIYSKATVLDDGQTKVALVVCDLISLPRHTVVEARKLIEERTGIPGAHAMISATHSHTGPVLSRESARDALDGGSKDLSKKYTAELPALIARSVAEANSRLAPARLFYGRESEPRMAFNRRYWMQDGTVGWNPGKRNPKTLRPVGPIDPEVGVLYCESTNRKPVLTYVNYAMHPDTTGGQFISADYPGALSRFLALYRGSEMVTIFANGACGNLNHVNVQWADPQKGTNEANRLGTILAAAVFKAYMDLVPASNNTLRVRSEIVELPLPQVTEEEVAQARAVAARKDPKTRFMDLLQTFKVLDVEARAGKPHQVEVQVIALGRELAWVSLPGEIFVELGLNIKAASPFKLTFIAELANGAIGYVPNRSAYAEGNYEVVSARCAEGSGELLVAAAIRMLRTLHAEGSR
jgi:neutral ceramidase